MPDNEQELARDLGFLEAYTMGLGTMIGAGIFVLPSIAAANAGPASMISFAIGGFVSLLAALSLSELATGMPKAGGSYYYINRSLGSFFGSIVGLGMWSGLTFATAFYMLGFAQYMTYFYGQIPVGLTALVMAFLLIFLNYRGTKETATFQNLIVILLAGFIIIFVSFCIFEVDLETLRPFNPDGWSAVAATAATVYVSFIGFEVIATSAEEIKNPAKNLPLSMIASVLTPTLFYILVMFVSTGILPIAEIATSNIPVADVAEVVMGTPGALMMVIGAVLATVSSANASILSAARVNFAMGRDGVLTKWLNDVHRDYRTPYRSILVTGALIMLLIAVGVGVETLADVASFTYLVTYALVHVAVIVMRRAQPEDYDPDFELPALAYPIVPVLGCVLTVIILFQMRPIVITIGSAIILAGAIWFVIYARTHAGEDHLIGEAIIRPQEKFEEAESDRYKIVVPIANPGTERHLLRLAAASAQSHENAELIVINVIEVPDQTALAQDLEYEEERIEIQKKLLNSAREFAEQQNIGLGTRAILGRDIGDGIVRVLEEENADQILMGWKGGRSTRENILGSNIDKVVREAPCEVTLVKSRKTEIKNVAALISQGVHAPVAVRRAHEFAEGVDGGNLTLVHATDDSEADVDFIDSLVERVGLSDEEYETRIVETDDPEGSLLSASHEYDTVCVGATGTSAFKQVLFGSIPETIGDQSLSTVAMVRGRQTSPRSLAQAIRERVGG
jgi:amino acid transporter/nucleotide-binding universal stress UspA family protein